MATRLSGRPAIQEPRASVAGGAAADLRSLQVAIQNIRERLRLIEGELNKTLNESPVVLSGPSANVVTSVQAGLGGAILRGALQLIGGSGMNITSAGNAIQFTSTATAGVNSINNLQADVDVVGGLGIYVSTSGQTIEVASNLVAGDGIELVAMSGDVLRVETKLVAGVNVTLAVLSDGAIEISAVGGSGGGGGVTSLNSLTGHVNIIPGDGIAVTEIANNIEVSANLVADDGVSLTLLSGGAIAVGANLVAGPNVTITPVSGGALEISATGGGSGGGGGVQSLNSLTGHVDLVAGQGITITPVTGNALEVAANLVADDGIQLTLLTGGAIAIGALLVAGTNVTLTPLTGGAIEISAAGGGSGGGGGVLSLNSLTGHVDLVGTGGTLITVGTGNTIEIRSTAFTVSTTPPLDGNEPGDRWVDSDAGVLYTWYDDGSSAQWVEFGGQSGSNLPIPVPIESGGTGQITAADAINALLPTQTGNSGRFLTTDGSVASWANVTQPLQGSWTPVISGTGGGSFSGVTSFARYIRIGDDVIVYGNFTWTGVSGFSGGLKVEGLPFDVGAQYSPLALYCQGLSTGADNWTAAYFVQTTDYFTIGINTYAGGVGGLSSVASSGTVGFFGCYRV